MVNSFYRNETRIDPSAFLGVEFRCVSRKPWAEGGRWNVFDVSGSDPFRSLIKVYVPGTDAVLLAFDVADRSSFESLDGWLDWLSKEAGLDPNIPVMLVGIAQQDRPWHSGPIVTQDVAQVFADARRLLYVGTSLKVRPADPDLGVDRVLDTLSARLAWPMGRQGSPQKSMTPATLARPTLDSSRLTSAWQDRLVTSSRRISACSQCLVGRVSTPLWHDLPPFPRGADVGRDSLRKAGLAGPPWGDSGFQRAAPRFQRAAPMGLGPAGRGGLVQYGCRCQQRG
eukprot:CAMPEP_0198524486 /NCGR_PEP_ID=MMETSP1462-20131121/22775_1 /TAXON_ID=1333877 /ORGANISM="Brandtodinium nutriculum, Strain RCC3387" /LENGTH=282 /DNA_ID=CAMNT_0044254215 /DNA_START=76 /DNA_END=921 /DNA_ORIENTATION=+